MNFRDIATGVVIKYIGPTSTTYSYVVRFNPDDYTITWFDVQISHENPKFVHISSPSGEIAPSTLSDYEITSRSEFNRVLIKATLALKSGMKLNLVRDMCSEL